MTIHITGCRQVNQDPGAVDETTAFFMQRIFAGACLTSIYHAKAEWPFGSPDTF